MDVPSMVRRSGNQLIVRQVVSGRQEVLGECIKVEVKIEPPQQQQQQQPPIDDIGLSQTNEPVKSSIAPDHEQQQLLLQPAGRKSHRDQRPADQLPQCKVKRNYACPRCAYGTQNPRRYLTHLRDTHGEKISINACQRCLYASKHHQKLVRHMRMVHGTVEPRTRGTTAEKKAAQEEEEENEEQLTDRQSKRKGADSRSEPLDGSLGRSLTTGEVETDAGSTVAAYEQQLVASDFQRLLKQIENTWNSSIAAANFELNVRNALKIEMDNLHNDGNGPVNARTTPLEETMRKTRRSMEDTELTPRKRSRPIPNLIPLGAPPPLAVRPEKELLKPVPMSMLMPQSETSPPGEQLSPGSHQQATNGASPLVRHTQMKCTFCELSYDSTVDLANHIEAAHKEDLFTSLLQKSIDDSQQNLFPQSDTDSASNELWKSLLEVGSGGGSDGAQTKSVTEPPNGRQPAAQAATVDDDDVEILENKTNETYCGIETAPGYGEVTSKLPTPDPSASNAVTKKVFKCPHCSFWASTASRFHVHIVGHLNKKPFECSLCSYRSNWRWDITKHIRLKTIRDPSHKNAGVLMNDETGRRNYTKYNKYITLMQITDSSAKDSATYGKVSAENTVADLLAACSTYNIDLKAFANIPGYKLLLAHKQLGEDAPGSGPHETKHYGAYQMKCTVCEFRTSSNEELLLHTTTAHADPNMAPLDGDVMETDATAGAGGSALQPRNCTMISSGSPADPTPAPSSSSVVLCNLSQSVAANTGAESATNGTLLTASPSAMTTTTTATPTTTTTTTSTASFTGGAGDRTNASDSQGTVEAGEGGSQRMAVPTWRHNAPYRCGHCHQVSNWKHVIQRHCRLKHNGHVLIEHISAEKDDPSDGEGPAPSAQHRGTKQPQHSNVYIVEDGQQHAVTGSTESRGPPALGPPPPLAPFACDDLGSPFATTLEPIVEILDKDPTELSAGSTVLVSSGTVAPVIASDQLDCVSCQFHAETIEQLTEHLEAHISNGQGREGSYSIAPTTLLDPVPTVLFYCGRCPARFFDRCHVMDHEARHAPSAIVSGGTTVCPACTYTIPPGDDPGRHLEVHSAAYNKNTENLQIFLAESKDFPKPRLTVHENPDRTVVWCVEPVAPGEDPTANPVGRTPIGPSPTAETSPKRTKRSKLQQEPRNRRRMRSSVDTASIGTDQPPLRSIFLCEYCDSAFDAESELNAHIRSHFSAILAAQNVAYYTSLNNALHREQTLELVVTGARSTLPLHYVYDNTRSQEWAPFSKAESVLLKL